MRFRRSSKAVFALLILAASGCCGGPAGGQQAALSPGIPGAWSFTVLGDSRVVALDSWCVSRRLIGMIVRLRTRPDFLVDCGDLINSPGSRIQWYLFDKQFSPVREVMPLYPVIGNHDVDDAESQKIYTKRFHLPGEGIYYSFDHRGAHFVILDTEVPGEMNSIGGAQLAWLEKDLSAAHPTEGTFVFMHRPSFPQSGYRSEPLKDREELHRLFVSRGVTAVFAGHEHFYNRTVKDGILYIITGGGGAHLITGTSGSWHHFVLVSVRGRTFEVQAVDDAGKVRDDIREEK